MDILETVEVDDLIEVRVRWVLGADLLPYVILVAAWLIKHLGDMTVLRCFIQSFGRVKIKIGGSAAVSKFQMTRRMPMSNRAYGTGQSQGLAV